MKKCLRYVAACVFALRKASGKIIHRFLRKAVDVRETLAYKGCIETPNRWRAKMQNQARDEALHILAVALASETGQAFTKMQPFDKDAYLRRAELLLQSIEKKLGA